MIKIKKCSINIKNKSILNEVTCTFEPGRITCLIGKSGAGKTTLLKAVGGMINISFGTITVNEQNINTLTPRERALKIGFVFQDFNLFTHMTVLQNCVDPQLVQGVSKQKAHERALGLLAELDIAHLISSYPRELSGGQQQRVAIVRALCLQPQVLLLDEPTASLDPENSALLAQLLKHLANKGLTICLSSQDMQFVASVFDCAYFIENGLIVEYCANKNMINDYPKIQSFISL